MLKIQSKSSAPKSAKLKPKGGPPKKEPKSNGAAKAAPDKELSSKYHPVMEQIIKLKKSIEQAEAAILAAKEEQSDLLGKIGQVSFKYKKSYFSIRNRGGRRYITESDVPAGSWRRKE